MFLVSKTEAQSSVLNVADSLYNLGNYSAAINEYAKAGTERASFQIAKAYNAIGNYDKAIVQYENVVSKNPKFHLAKFNLAKLYLKMRKSQQALSTFTTLITPEGNNPEYYYYKGRALQDLQKDEEALIWYKKAVNTDSTHLRSIFKVGKYYVTKKQRDSALQYVNKGLSFYKKDASLINLKALTLFNDEQYQESISLFLELLDLGERKPHVYNRLARAYFRAFEYEKSIETYKNLIALEAVLMQTDPKTFNALAGVYVKNKQLDSARVYVQKAIDEQVYVLDVEYAILGHIARMKEDFKTAIKYYKLAHKENPLDPIYYYQVCILGDIYYKDPKIKLQQYEALKEKYKNSNSNYFTAFATRRISELKTDIFENGD